MNITFSQAKIKGEERKTVLATVQGEVQQAALAAIRPVLQSYLEMELSAKLGRERYAPRTVSNQIQLLDWECAGCGCREAQQFIRDGHYRRQLETGIGHLTDLKVPMIECCRCGHDVVAHWAILEKYKRFWLDLDHRILFEGGLTRSLRQLSEQLAISLNSPVGLRSLEERFKQLEPLLQQSRQQTLEAIPPVVQFDGIWFCLQTQTGQVKVDKKGRKRPVHQGARRVVLVALGLWPDGRHQILDWHIAVEESQEEWETLLNRLYERGLLPEQGLKAIIRDGGNGLGEAVAVVYGNKVVDQRCIFHKLQNVSKACQKVAKEDKEGRARRRQLMAEASAVYQAGSAAEALVRLEGWKAKWGEQEPKAAATFERDFEKTVAYYQLEEKLWSLARTTSRLERTNRELRRKFRQVGAYGSEEGATTGIYLQVERLNGQWRRERWWEVSNSLLCDLLDLNP
jgi:hypothetical protein